MATSAVAHFVQSRPLISKSRGRIGRACVEVQHIICARPNKESNPSHHLYEIKHLRFALDRLGATTLPHGHPEKNLLIEGALLHFRNLMEFFSGPNYTELLSSKRPEVWAQRGLPDELSNLSPICVAGARFVHCL